MNIKSAKLAGLQCFGWFFLIHLNTYVMSLDHVSVIIYSFTLRDAQLDIWGGGGT